MVVGWKLKELSSADFTCKHVFELGCYHLIYFLVRIRPTKKDKVVKEELEEMLKAQIIEPIYSPWGSKMVIAQMKDGSLHFCIVNWALNKRMRGINILSQMSQRNRMAGAKVF